MIGIESYPLNRYLMDQARRRRRDHQPFMYQGEASFSAAAGQERTIIIDIDTDAPFLWTGLRGEASRSGLSFSAEPGPDIRIMIRYGGAGGRAWAQTPVHWNNCIAYRPVPYILPFPKVIPRGSQLHATLTLDSSLAGVFPILVRLQYVGTKLFRWRAA